MHEQPRAVGGRLLTPAYKVLLTLAGLAFALIGFRFAAGLGRATALSDGYPWGIWIAFDVVTGTALACGGYAVAILVYILNRGHYHPMIRPAILTSAIGYTLAMVTVGIDVGRPWLAFKVPLFFWTWNLNSVLLEVALCILAYVFVLWMELSPALLEKWAADGSARLHSFAKSALPLVEKALPVIATIGIVLPTMHQSSLGSLMLLSGPRLHRLWFTPLLPVYFLITCVAMGHAIVVFESIFASKVFGRRLEFDILKPLQKIAAIDCAIFVVVRLIDLGYHGRLGLVAQIDRFGMMFWIETLLFLVPLAIAFVLPATTGNLFRGAVVLLLAGAVFRFDTFLVAFQPGPGWHYFPSVVEILITVGLVAAEIAAYVAIVRSFPILSGSPAAATQTEKQPIVAGDMNPAPVL